MSWMTTSNITTEIIKQEEISVQCIDLTTMPDKPHRITRSKAKKINQLKEISLMCPNPSCRKQFKKINTLKKHYVKHH